METNQARTKTTKPLDLVETVARAKALQPTWVLFFWERMGDDLLVGLGQTRPITRGPRKGRSTWVDTSGQRLPHTKVVVTRGEMIAAQLAHEAETGCCYQCGGDGLSWAGWSADEGTKYSSCGRCDGTGKAPTKETP